MSYAPTNHSWYTSKNNAVPAHPGPIPHLYNPSLGANSTQQQPPPVWNNGVQQQPYWHSNPSTTPPAPRPPSVNQGNIHPAGDNSWNWGSQTQYQAQPHQQGTLHHQQQQDHHHHQQQPQPQYSQPTPASYHPNTEQYFYGNANTQPALSSNSDPWNWGVDDSSSTEGVSNNNMDAVDPTWNWSVEGSTAYQQQQQQQPPTNTFVPNQPTQQLPHGNSPSLQEAFSVSSSSSNYSAHDVSHHFQAQPDTKHSSISLSNHSEESGMGIYENVNLQQSSSQLQSAPSVNHFGSDSNNQIKENRSNIHESVHLQPPIQNNFVQSSYTNTTSDASLHETPSAVPQPEAFSRPDVGHEVYTHETVDTVIADTHFSSVPSNVSGDVIPRDDRTELTSEMFVHSELSVSSVMRHDRQVLAADGLLNDHQELDFSVTSKHSSTGLTPQWSTESLPSQGSDEVSHTLEGGSRNDFMPSPLSTVSQSPLLTDGNYDHNQFDSLSSYHNTPSPARVNGPTLDNAVKSVASSVHGDESCASDFQPPAAASSQSVESVRQQMTRLHVDAESKTKLDDVDNKEIVPPESSSFDAPTEGPTPPLVSGFAPPPPMLASPPGPPKPGTVAGNPYAGSRNSLTHKSASKYRVPGETVGFGVPPPPVAIEPAPERDVNLETLPDNEERPDVVESSSLERRRSLSPAATRSNAPMMGQEPSARQRPPPTATYSASPENQEVAPRCGPDRNQYLETGQLSDDEGYRPREGWGRTTPPPPGLHRMVPGQTERVSSAPGDGGGRMAPADGDIPPPGLRRMVPGESSSPESQGVGSSQPGPASSSGGNSFQPIGGPAPMEARVVTGVSREEVDGQTAPSSSAAPPSPDGGSPGPGVDRPSTDKNQQPTAERSETIGSDSVETYPPPPADNAGRDIGSSNRRENPKERERRHREDEPTDERDGRRRTGHGGYRDREESPGWFERDKRSHRAERDRRGDGERRERPKSTRDNRGRRDESPDSRRYREDRVKDRKRYDAREGYGNYRPSDERRRYGRRTDYRDTDTGSEYSDYDRRGYDRRDYDRRDNKSGHRGREDHTPRYRDGPDSRRHRDNRSHHDRSRLEDKSYRDKRDHRPDSREQTATQFVPPLSGFHGLNGRTLAEYLNYYSNLRNYDAVAYADWYNNVYKSLSYQQPTSYAEDRGSVHSGRSSANSGIYRDRFERSGVYNATDYYRRSPVSLGSSDRRLSREIERATTSLTEDHRSAASPAHRLTPSKYATAHVKGVLTGRGTLIKVLPHYPLDGQPGIVEIHDIQGFFASDAVRRELADYPGPLVKGVTHKNSLIAFCNGKIKSAESNTELFDRESVILLWRLLVLLLRQNGTVVGADIAELLLGDGRTLVAVAPARPSAGSTPASFAGKEDGRPEETVVSGDNRSVFNVRSEEELTDSFREFLLYGNTKEALEWAMKNGLWGHALFLASKMDQRTYANVMTRFANGLTMNDPLQTLYQLMSGRQPAAVTCCADERWGDWRPHLAMILSNSSSQRLELNHKSITTLGDTLGSRGCLHAAHFTYLMAQVDFGTYAQKGAKVVLLGSSHHKHFQEFATNEAIQMTEIYEYACKLAEPEFTIRPLQAFKLIYATRLAEQGLVAEAMQYAEELSGVLLRHPEHYTPSLVKDVYELGDRLKYNDPLYECGVGPDGADQELPWLVKMRRVVGDIDSGVMQQDVTSYGSVSNLSYTEGESFQHGTVSTDPLSQIPEPVSYDYNWQQQQLQQQQYVPQAYLDPAQEQWQEQNHQQQLDQQPNEMADAFQTPQVGQSQPQQEWPTTPQSISQWDTQGNSTMIGDQQQQQQQQQQQPYSNYWDQSTAHEELPAPQISLPNSMPERSQKTQETDMHPKPSAKSNQKKDASKSNAGNGWFGGLWNKLALRPKNQMKLPDDKNPTIVWDSDRKRWTNLDADGEETSGDLPPPPKMMANSIPSIPAAQPAAPNHTSGDQSQTNSLPPPMNPPNMYKMNRGRSLRSNYVDILGGNKPTSQSVPPPADIFPPVGTAQPQNMNFFVPGASAEVTETSSNPAPLGSSEPATNQHDNSTQHLSRWSSASSLSREVQSYTMRGRQSVGPKGSEPQHQGYGGPLMFNPNNYAQPIPYTANSNSNQFKNRYPHK